MKTSKKMDILPNFLFRQRRISDNKI